MLSPTLRILENADWLVACWLSAMPLLLYFYTQCKNEWGSIVRDWYMQGWVNIISSRTPLSCSCMNIYSASLGYVRILFIDTNNGNLKWRCESEKNSVHLSLLLNKMLWNLMFSLSSSNWGGWLIIYGYISVTSYIFLVCSQPMPRYFIYYTMSY